jgi:hypothetical protein
MGSIVWHVILLTGLAQLPPVEVETLQSETQKGAVARWTDKGLTLKVGDGGDTREIDVPLANVLEVRFQTPPSVPAPVTGSVVTLADGTKLQCTQLATTGAALKLDTVSFGELTVPLAAVAHVRLKPPSTRMNDAWSAILGREFKQDALVVLKKNEAGETLDHLTGVIGELNDKQLSFLLDGDEIAVNREKVYGWIYRRRGPAPKSGIGQVHVDGGDVLQVDAVAWDGSQFTAKLVAGPQVVVPVDKLRSIDLSRGKVQYLSRLDPREVKYETLFQVLFPKLVKEDVFLFPYRRDTNLDGGPISLGGKSYSRGLALHSRTTLRYRIGGDYRRFHAVAGIDDRLRGVGGYVYLVVRGDGKVLFDAELRDGDSPRPLDVDVTDIRDLEIFCDFCKGTELSDLLDIGDHLDLAEARVVK